ncbi:MAG: nitrous oxide reductase family maturation protein NosD [Gemmatimonadaceae bacterium]
MHTSRRYQTFCLARAVFLAHPLVATSATRALAQAATIVVDPQGAVSSVHEGIRLASTGGRVVVRRGVYREPVITIDRRMTLEGEAGATLDGSGAHTVLVITADDVTVRGFTIRNTGSSQSQERAGLRAQDARGCRLENNRLEETQFAIYLSKVSACLVEGNVIQGSHSTQATSGNGIHLWYSNDIEIAHNEVHGHRDGIYFEFVRGGRVHDNTSEQNARYGMHFMFSDDCRYERNVYRDNGNGVAVMYSKRVEMIGNRFADNGGSAAYGLLLKNINDSYVANNDFTKNSVGLYLEDSNRNRVRANRFLENGWALKVMANAQENTVERNVFELNTFDVTTNSRSNFSRFNENYWERYRGYDLDRDGIGDVPHTPVRLFALVVAQTPPTIILMRSLLVDLLDLAEHVLPALTPETLVDQRPLMKRPRAGASHD